MRQSKKRERDRKRRRGNWKDKKRRDSITLSINWQTLTLVQDYWGIQWFSTVMANIKEKHFNFLYLIWSGKYPAHRPSWSSTCIATKQWPALARTHLILIEFPSLWIPPLDYSDSLDGKRWGGSEQIPKNTIWKDTLIRLIWELALQSLVMITWRWCLTAPLLCLVFWLGMLWASGHGEHNKYFSLQFQRSSFC